jgi:hypothetical protein
VGWSFGATFDLPDHPHRLAPRPGSAWLEGHCQVPENRGLSPQNRAFLGSGASSGEVSGGYLAQEGLKGMENLRILTGLFVLQLAQVF